MRDPTSGEAPQRLVKVLLLKLPLVLTPSLFVLLIILAILHTPAWVAVSIALVTTFGVAGWAGMRIMRRTPTGKE
jgi:hypothetical protein